MKPSSPPGWGALHPPPAVIVSRQGARLCHERRANPEQRDGCALSFASVSAPAVPAPLAYVPNALTVLRLALIPVFVAVLVPAEGGYSWPAAILFGIAG